MKKPLANWIALASCLLLFSIGIPAQSAVDSAKKLFDAGQFKDAETMLRAEVARNANDPVLQYWLAKCAFELYDDDLAFSSAERAVNLDPKNADYHYFLGTTAGYKAEHSNWFSGLSLARKTQHEFLTAVQLNPDLLEAQRDLISYYIAAPGIAGGGDEKAQAQITQLDVVHVVSARLARMELYENRKKWTEAENEAKSVLAARPKQLKTFLEVAEFYQNREDAAGIRNALAGVPRDAAADLHVAYYRAVADVIAGENLTAAQKSMDAYLSMKPPPRREDHVTLGDAHSWLGRLYLRLGQRASANAECHAALKLEPKNRYAHDCLRRIDSQ
jgi:Tfp pilus assembly protein PilF